jgi:hypothetical protein
MTPQEFEAWAALSRSFHGNRYVLPLAAWMVRNEVEATNASQAMAGLGGLAERVRILEALGRLVEIGALEEMPRVGAPNSPRYFSRIDDAYWLLVGSYAERIERRVQASERDIGSGIGPR